MHYSEVSIDFDQYHSLHTRDIKNCHIPSVNNILSKEEQNQISKFTAIKNTYKKARKKYYRSPGAIWRRNIAGSVKVAEVGVSRTAVTWAELTREGLRADAVDGTGVIVVGDCCRSCL